MKCWHRLGLGVISCMLVAGCATTPGVKIINSEYTIIAPKWKFAIQFPAEGFAIGVEDTRRPFYFFINKATGLNVSFNFERAKSCNSSESCRDYWANKLKEMFPNKKDWRFSRLGDIFISEHMDGPVSESDREQLRKLGREKDLADNPVGLDLRQRHWNAHIVKKGIWVDVHLSKTNYQEEDQKLFITFLRSMIIRSKD